MCSRHANLLLPFAAAPLPSAQPAAPCRAQRRRLRLWELRSNYHCPVIGTCLTTAELRRIARGVGVHGGEANSEYELHATFVHYADQRGEPAKRLQKRLDQKHASAVRRCAPVDSAAELLRIWDAARRGGDIAGTLWAVMTHPAADDELRHRVYQDVHMLSHQVGAENRADLRRLSELEADNRRLQDELRSAAARAARNLAQKEERIAALQARAAAGECAARRLRELEGGEAVRALQAQIADLERRLAAQALRADQAEQRVRRLQRQDGRAAPPPVRLPTPAAACRGCAAVDTCTAEPDLCGRRVLCVGGLSGISDRYRALVEHCNGCFEHHDGGLEENNRCLDGLLGRADLVICPADSVSHDAYWRVKRFCKQHGKPCLMLRSSGVSSFERALQRLARDTSEQRIVNDNDSR